VNIPKKFLDNRTRFQCILNAEPNPSIAADVRAALTPSIKEGIFLFYGRIIKIRQFCMAKLLVGSMATAFKFSAKAGLLHFLFHAMP